MLKQLLSSWLESLVTIVDAEENDDLAELSNEDDTDRRCFCLPVISLAS